MGMAADNGAERATRRSPGEAKVALVAAARELFAANGYSGTSTRQIAEHAGVADSILYRNFRTKADLFDAAVVEPVRRFLAGYIDQWAGHTELAQPADLPTREFVVGLYDVLREHRALVMALASAHAFDGDAIDSAASGPPLADLLDGLQSFVAEAAERNGFTWLNVPLAIRFTIGMVLSTAVFGDWVFPAHDDDVDHDTLVEEMVQFVLHGIAHPRDSAPPPPARRKGRRTV